MKKLTRALLFVMVAVMLIGVMPFCAFAAMTADEVITVGFSKKLTLTKDHFKHVYEFTAPEDGDYILWSEDNLGDPFVSVYDGDGIDIEYDDDGGKGYNFKQCFDAYEGEKYYFEISTYTEYDKNEFTVKFAKATVPQAIVTEIEGDVLNLLKEDYRYYDYGFERDTDAGEVAYTLEGDDCVDVHVGSNDFSVSAFAPGSVKLTLYCVNYPTVKKEITINVSDTILSLNTPVVCNRQREYTFVAPTDGVYAFTFDSQKNVDFRVETPDNTYRLYDKKGAAVEHLYAGDEVEVSVDVNADTTVLIKPAVAATGLEIRQSNVAYAGIATHYAVAPVNSDGIVEYCTFTVKDNKGNIVGCARNWAVIEFDSAGTYTLIAESDESDLKAECNVTVYPYPTLTVNNSVSATVKKYVAADTSQQAAALFTAPEDGFYEFTITSDKDVSVTSYFGSQNASNYYETYLDKDDTVNISFFVDDYSVGDTQLTAAVRLAPEATAFTMPESLTVHAGEEILVDITTTPEDAILECYVDTADEDIADVFYNHNGELYVYGGDVGQTTITIDSPFGIKTLNVTVVEAEKLVLDKVYTIDFSKVFIRSFSFTPDQSGFYNFVGPNLQISVRDADDDYVKDVYGEESGYAYLEKGIEYIVRVDENSYGSAPMALGGGGYRSGSVLEFKVVKAKAAESLTVPGGKVVVNVGDIIDSYSAAFAPYDAMIEEFVKMTSSDPTVVEVTNDYGYLEGTALKEGTATLEVETSYGLKGSIKVEVVSNDLGGDYVITTDKKIASIQAGKSETLKATITGKAPDMPVMWSSGDESVAVVDANGKVTAKKPGKVIIYAVCGYNIARCLVTVTAPEIKDTSKIFKDVEAGRWYVNAINYNYSYGFIAGMSADTFGASNQITRGQFITILARIAGVDTSANANKTTTKFTDVESGRFYTAAIKWASDNKIVAGMTDSTFAPTAPIQRQQLCVMIVNFAKNQKIGLTAAESAVTFADAAQIGNYAKEAVAVCQRADIINGYNEGGKLVVKPANTATRAEAAQILYKFHKDFVNK